MSDVQTSVRVGDKVTLSDWMYDDERWGYARWVTEARNLVGIVTSVSCGSFYIEWVGLSEKSSPSTAMWDDKWVKVLGSTVE